MAAPDRPLCIDMREPEEAARAAEHLELGNILHFAPPSGPVPSPTDQAFLREELPAALRFKNISYHPDGDYLTGMKGAKELRARTTQILREHARVSAEFLGQFLPAYAERWWTGKVNFRPLEEKGRNLKRSSSNEYLHTDALASGATHGDRILRFFTNINPTESRYWRSGGTFDDLYERYGVDSGVTPDQIRDGFLGKGWSVFVGAASRLVPAARMADMSAYDRTMKKFHNYLKDNDAFQKNTGAQVRLEFPPYSSWAVMTDMVSHAVISGRHALVSTFHVNLNDCVRPDLAPIKLLSA